MSTKLRAERELTTKTTFRRDPFRGEMVKTTGTNPKVVIDRTNAGPGINKVLSETLSGHDMEVLIAILQGMRDELMMDGVEVASEARG